MKKESKLFTVIVGDLVGSRNILDRRNLAHKIHRIIDHINRNFEGEFYAPFVLTQGIDELSAVLKKSHMSYRICRLLNESLSPHLFRFAVVRGVLDVAVVSKNAGKMDGPAFHVGANLIRQAKKENLYYCFSLKPQCEEINQGLTELAGLAHIISSNWTQHQSQVVQLYKTLRKQKAVAEKLHVTQQAVSDALVQAHWKDLKRVEAFIDLVLSRFDSNK
jgi:hypothetical protein